MPRFSDYDFEPLDPFNDYFGPRSEELPFRHYINFDCAEIGCSDRSEGRMYYTLFTYSRKGRAWPFS